MTPSTSSTGIGRHRMAQESRAAAHAVWSFLAPGYGPHGGHRLLDLQDDVQLLPSAASGLNEQSLDPDMVPFQDLAASVRSAVGDQATTASLLMARLVRDALDLEADGVPRPVILDGIAMARRQAMATLRSTAEASTPWDALAHTSRLGAEAVDVVVQGLEALAQEAGGDVALDDVDIRVEDAPRPEWADGTFVDPQHGPDDARRTDLGVLVLDGGWSIKPRSEGMRRTIRNADAWVQARNEEQSMRRGALERLLDLGVGLVVCGKDMDDDLCLEAARQGVWVWTSAPKSARNRLVRSTGASSAPDLAHATSEDVGRADMRRRSRRRGGWWVVGPATSATITLPSTLPVTQAAVEDDGERLLRAAGVVLADPRMVPGGGRWQRHVARALQKAGIHASGKSALAVAMVADVFDAMADQLVVNGGHDPMDHPLLPDADDVADPAPCVLAAVQAAFHAAATMLRIDGRYDKRPSTPESLRGGDGPIGSPKGMPGDVPPLM